MLVMVDIVVQIVQIVQAVQAAQAAHITHIVDIVDIVQVITLSTQLTNKRGIVLDHRSELVQQGRLSSVLLIDSCQIIHYRVGDGLLADFLLSDLLWLRDDFDGVRYCR